MYRVLIADDEEAIRIGIAENNPWEEWGYEVCGLCENGQQVIDSLERTRPDVVLSDIRMPGMDGVELMQYLNQNDPEVKIVILSGYSDFEYLNMSIKNRVTEYLLKPTDLDEFEEVFRRLKRKMDEERIRNKEIDQSIRIHFNAWLLGMLKGTVEDQDTSRFLPMLADKGICLEQLVVVAYVPDEMENGRTRSFMQQLLCLAGELSGEWDGQYFFLDRGNILLEFVSGRNSGAEEVRGFVERFQRGVRDRLQASVSAGISNLCDDVSLLPQAYEQAVRCARQNLFAGRESIYQFQELLECRTDNLSYFNNERIEKAILNQDMDEIGEELDRVLSSFDGPLLDYQIVDNRCLTLLSHISLWGLHYGVVPEKLMEDKGVSYMALFDCHSLEKKREFVLNLIKGVMAHMEDRQIQGHMGSRVARKIQEYVDAKYCSNTISLESVAAYVQKTPAYVSRLFKKELNYNFIDYLTEKRINHAVMLLKNTDAKIYEIAGQCGYADPSNFIRVFRRVQGISPTEYRALQED